MNHSTIDNIYKPDASFSIELSSPHNIFLCGTGFNSPGFPGLQPHNSSNSFVVFRTFASSEADSTKTLYIHRTLLLSLRHSIKGPIFLEYAKIRLWEFNSFILFVLKLLLLVLIEDNVKIAILVILGKVWVLC